MRHATKNFRHVKPKDALEKATIVESISPLMLYPSAVPESGATIRIPAPLEAEAGDTVELFWVGKGGIVPWQNSQLITSVGRFIDFTVPKRVILESAGPIDGECMFIYRVIIAGVGAPVSPRHDFYVAGDGPALPAPTVPDYPSGAVDFSSIDSLRVDIPDSVIFGGAWTVWSRAGELTEVPIGFVPGETFIAWPELLHSIEPGGRLAIRYTGRTGDGLVTDSRSVYLTAL